MAEHLEKWRELYNIARTIEKYSPWDNIPSDIPLVYQRADGSQIFYMIYKNMNDDRAITFYTSGPDFFYARARMALALVRGEPADILQNGFGCVWENRSDMSRDDLDVIRSLGLRFRGNGNWPHFREYRERFIPTEIHEELLEFIIDCFGNLYAMLHAYYEDKIPVDFENGETISRTVRDGEWFNIVSKENYGHIGTHITIRENSDLRSLKKMVPAQREIEFEEFCAPVILEDEYEDAYCPIILLITDAKTGQLVNAVFLDSSIDDRVESIFDTILNDCMENGKPQKIYVSNIVTYDTIRDLCKKAKIPVENLNRPMDNTDKIMLKLADPDISDEALRQILDDAVEDEDEDEDSTTFVISVSLGKGCYRHLKISGGCTLEELSFAILDAFEFDNDHAHAFFMSNKAWDRDNAYYTPMFYEERLHTDEYTLSQVLSEKQKFLYIFDFGDEWRFSCSVLRIEDKPCEEVQIVRAVGEAPVQYPVWDDEDWDED